MNKLLGMAMMMLVGCSGAAPSAQGINLAEEAHSEYDLVDIHVRLEQPPVRPRTVCLRVDDVVVGKLVFTASNFDRLQHLTVSVSGVGAVTAGFDPEDDGVAPIPGIGPINPAGGVVRTF
jgi:hypothetical protein